MIELTQEEEVEIRNRLDYIAENLHRGIVSLDDIAWAHGTIKKILYINYELQHRQRGDKRYGERSDIPIQPSNVDFRNKST